MRAWLVVVFTASLVTDQLTKAQSNYNTLNELGPFSMTAPNTVWVFLAFVLLLGVTAFTFLRRQQLGRYGTLGPVLLLAGGTSNLFDRLRFGGVREIGGFADISFNIADVLILLGAIQLLSWTVISYWQARPNKRRSTKRTIIEGT